MGIGRQRAGPRTIDIDFAEDQEIRDPLRLGARLHRGHEGLPELGVHMLDRIDPETVDPEPVDPAAEDIDHPGKHARMLGRQIVEPREIAVDRAFAPPLAVAAIMVVDRIVEPCGHFDVPLRLGHHGGVGEARIGQLGPVFWAVIIVAREVRVDPLTLGPAKGGKRIVRLAAIGIVAARILDHVGGVVGDDVHIDLHPARVRRIDEGLEFGIGAQMRVDRGEVGHPIAVVARALVTRRALHRLVLEDRREPDRGDAEPLDIVELLGQALQIAAVVEAAMGRVVAAFEPVRRIAAGIVGRIAIGEAVGQDEVDHLVLRQALARCGGWLLRERGGGNAEQAGCGEQGDGALHRAVSGTGVGDGLVARGMQ